MRYAFFLYCMLAVLLLASCNSVSNDDEVIISEPDPVQPDSSCEAIPPGDSDYFIRIVSLLPDPVGDDDYHEKFTVKNFNRVQSADLVGWKIRNNENIIWELDTLGTLPPHHFHTLVINRQAELCNEGGTIFLIAPNGRIVQTITYGKKSEGTVIRP